MRFNTSEAGNLLNWSLFMFWIIGLFRLAKPSFAHMNELPWLALTSLVLSLLLPFVALIAVLFRRQVDWRMVAFSCACSFFGLTLLQASFPTT